MPWQHVNSATRRFLGTGENSSSRELLLDSSSLFLTFPAIVDAPAQKITGTVKPLNDSSVENRLNSSRVA